MTKNKPLIITATGVAVIALTSIIWFATRDKTPEANPTSSPHITTTATAPTGSSPGQGMSPTTPDDLFHTALTKDEQYRVSLIEKVDKKTGQIIYTLRDGKTLPMNPDGVITRVQLVNEHGWTGPDVDAYTDASPFEVGRKFLDYTASYSFRDAGYSAYEKASAYATGAVLTEVKSRMSAAREEGPSVGDIDSEYQRWGQVQLLYVPPTFDIKDVNTKTTKDHVFFVAVMNIKTKAIGLGTQLDPTVQFVGLTRQANGEWKVTEWPHIDMGNVTDLTGKYDL